MKASVFDQRHYPTLPVQEGYTVWAATYDQATMKELMDYRLLARIDAVAWEQLETVADLACGNGRIGAWLKEHGVRLLDGVVCWLLGTSVLKRGCINSHSIGNFEPLLIGLRLGT
jgi:hypothetical protein